MTQTQAPGAEALPITEHELAALASLAEDGGGALAARLLGLEELRAKPEFVRAGLTTLLLRGLGQADEGLFTPSDKGEVLAAILATATDFLRVHVLAGEGENVTAFITSPVALLFLELHPTGIYSARPLPTSLIAEELVAAYIGATEADAVVPPPYRVRLVRLGEAGETRAELEVDEGGAWRLGEGPAGEAGATWRGALAELGFAG